MSHDEALVAKVAEALRREVTAGETDSQGWTIWRQVTLDVDDREALARAVLAALDLPGRERRAKAEALTEAADDMERIFRAGNLLGGPTDDWLRNRAAELDPEEGDNE